jgi:hypothetical protein
MENEFQKMQRLAGVPVTEDKKQLDENFVGIPMVGNIFDRPKTDYELAYEHYLGKLNENSVEEGTIEEDQTLSNINQLKQLTTQAINHYQELSKLSDEFAKINGYDTWREMGRDKGFTSYVNLFDQSVPNSQVNKLNDFISTGLKGDIEKYKADKSLELMRNKKQEKPSIPENIYEEEGADGEENPIDSITMDVPLFIRMLEFAREDASTDMDLHDVAEKATAMSAEGEVLSMDNYEDIVGGEAEELDEVGHFKYTSKRGYGDRKVGTYLGKYPIYQDDEGNNYIKTGSGIKDVEDLDQSKVKINN